MTLLAFVLAIVLIGPSPLNVPARVMQRSQPTELFVAPDGRPDAPGTIDRPLSLKAALSDESPAKPGDTVWLRGGTYRGIFVSAVKGLPDAPIVFRQYAGERAVIDSSPSPESALTVIGAWTTFWGFEITNSDPKRRSIESGPWPADLGRGTGVFARGPHNAFINLIVHDMANGFGVWSESEGSLVYGNIVYYNGWQGSERAHGHGIYTQNKVGVREIADNIVFGQFSHGIHAYGSSVAYLDDIVLRGNVVFNNGMLAATGAERDILLGGDRTASRPVLEDNATFGPAQSALGWSGGCTDGRVTGNYFVGGLPLVLVACKPDMRRNTFVGETGDLSKTFTGAAGDLSRAFPDNTYFKKAPEHGQSAALRVNRFEPDRAQLVIYNWDRQKTVTVDAAPFLGDGDRYELVDAQDVAAGPVRTSTYHSAERLQVPMDGSRIATPVGDVPAAPRHTGIEFGVFLLRLVARGKD